MEQYRRTQRRDRVRLLVSEHDPSGSEITMSAMALGWGVLLIVYPGSLSHLPSFAPMLVLAPQEVWAIAFLAAAVLAVIGVVTNRRWLRVASLAFHAFSWAFLAVVILSATPFAAGWWIYGCLAARACWGAWVVVRRGVE